MPEGRRYVLTGGGSQLTGIVDAASRILSKQVRVGRPRGESGMLAAAGDGYFARVGRWIRESF